MQWLDPPSADALAFAARRLDDRPVALPARAPPRPPGAARARAGAPAASSASTSARSSLGATRRLLAERLGLSLPRPLLRRDRRVDARQPAVRARGRARAARAAARRRPGEDIPVPEAVEDLLGTRVARLAAPARRLLLAVALSADLRLGELAAIDGPERRRRRASTAGVLRVDGDRVRAVAPAAGRGRAAALAARASGASCTARWPASSPTRSCARCTSRCATDRPDAGARRPAGTPRRRRSPAARASRRRSWPSTRCGSRRRPPPDRAERLLALASYLERAGEPSGSPTCSARSSTALPAGRAARARLAAARRGRRPADDRRDSERYLDRALAESERRAGACAPRAGQEGRRRPWPRRRRAHPRGRGLGARGARVARGDRDQERLALYALGWARALRGRPIDDLCERSGAASDAASYIADSPERVAGQRLVWRGELARAARALLTRLLPLADERGEPSSYALQRLHLCELELRAGDWAAAARRLDEWAESSDRELLIRPMYERCRALLAAGRGEPRGGRALGGGRARARGGRPARAGTGSRRCARAASPRCWPREPARAAESLRAVWEHTRARGRRRARRVPGRARARRGAGRARASCRGRARVSERLRELAERHGTPGGCVTARRCGALRAARRRLGRARRRDELAAAAADVRRARPALRPRAHAARLGRAQRAPEAVGRRARAARGAVDGVRRARLATAGRSRRAASSRASAGAGRGRPASSRRPSSASSSWPRGGPREQGDRPRAGRRGAHGRGAPLARLREARRALARAARGAHVARRDRLRFPSFR